MLAIGCLMILSVVLQCDSDDRFNRGSGVIKLPWGHWDSISKGKSQLRRTLRQQSQSPTARRSYEDPRFQLYEAADCLHDFERDTDSIKVKKLPSAYSISECASECVSNLDCVAFRYHHLSNDFNRGECEHVRFACLVENLVMEWYSNGSMTSYYVKKTMFEKDKVPVGYEYFPGRHCLNELIGYSGRQYDQSEYFHSEVKKSFRECVSLCNDLEICHGFTYQNVVPVEDNCFIYFQFCAEEHLYEYQHFNYFRKNNSYFKEALSGFELYYEITCIFASLKERNRRKWLNAADCATACVFDFANCRSFASRGIDECYHYGTKCDWLDMVGELEPGWRFYQMKELPMKGYKIDYNRLVHSKESTISPSNAQRSQDWTKNLKKCEELCESESGQKDFDGMGYGCVGFTYDYIKGTCTTWDRLIPASQFQHSQHEDIQRVNVYVKQPPVEKEGQKFCVFPFTGGKLSYTGVPDNNCAKTCDDSPVCMGYLSSKSSTNSATENKCEFFNTQPVSPLELMVHDYWYFYQKADPASSYEGFTAFPHRECYANVAVTSADFTTTTSVSADVDCMNSCLNDLDCYSFTIVKTSSNGVTCKKHKLVCYEKDLIRNCQHNYFVRNALPDLMSLPGYDVYPNLNCIGHAAVMNTTTSFERCKTACDYNPDCRSFGFTEHEGRKCEARTYACPLAALEHHQTGSQYYYNKHRTHEEVVLKPKPTPPPPDTDWGIDDHTIAPVFVVTPTPHPFWMKPGQHEIRYYILKPSKKDAHRLCNSHAAVVLLMLSVVYCL